MEHRQITVWADVRCPWCWIGHRQLGRTIHGLDRDVLIEYKSYLLEPDGPPRPGITVRDAATSSWGLTEGSWNTKRDNIIKSGNSESLNIRIDTALTVDSRAAHRLLKLAAARNLDVHQAWDAVYASHFDDNLDIGNRQVLRSIGQRIGLADDDITDLLDTDRYSDAVLADHLEGRAAGVRSIPTVMVGPQCVNGDLEDEVVQLIAAGRSESEL